MAAVTDCGLVNEYMLCVITGNITHMLLTFHHLLFSFSQSCILRNCGIPLINLEKYYASLLEETGPSSDL